MAIPPIRRVLGGPEKNQVKKYCEKNMKLDIPTRGTSLGNFQQI